MVSSEGSTYMVGDFGVLILRVDTSEIVEVDIHCCSGIISLQSGCCS